MFVRKPDILLENHVEHSVYRREKSIQDTTDKERQYLERFFEAHGVKHYDLPTQAHQINFSRTVNFVYIVEHTFAKHPNAHTVKKFGKDEGYGILRTKAFVFYRGIILYTLDHDFKPYPGSVTGHTTTNQKKCIKLNYGTHDELNNPILREIGKCCASFTKFSRACRDLLNSDKEQQSINFIKEATHG